MQRNKSKKLNFKYIWYDFVDRSRSIYFYVIGTYVLSRVASLFIKSWQQCNWVAFHIFIIVFSIIIFFHPMVHLFREGLYRIWRSNKGIEGKKIFGLPVWKDILKKTFYILISVMEILNRKLRKFLILQYQRIYRNKKLIFKLTLICGILGYALSKNIAMFDFWVLVYGMVAIVFIIESRISVSITLIFLIVCSVLLVLKQEVWMGKMAIYAYYFLIITIVVQIREIVKNSKLKAVDNIVANKKEYDIINITK